MNIILIVIYFLLFIIVFRYLSIFIQYYTYQLKSKSNCKNDLHSFKYEKSEIQQTMTGKKWGTRDVCIHCGKVKNQKEHIIRDFE